MPAALKELANQAAVLLAASLLRDYISASAVVYCANVLFAEFMLAPADGRTVHECNRCLLRTTLRVSCSFLLYGVLALFNSRSELK